MTFAGPRARRLPSPQYNHLRFWDKDTSCNKAHKSSKHLSKISIICHIRKERKSYNYHLNGPHAWLYNYGIFHRPLSLISGDDLGNFLLDSESIMEQERTNPSLYWLMPKDYYWDPKDVFIQSDNFNFTVKNYQKVTNTINLHN